ncbi:MAG TPA: hypothetical protein VGQ44_09645 [Gemmatimonadaceae bacterium]|nr:hypothetical protein [Gemmatimonadaceae bacterium]
MTRVVGSREGADQRRVVEPFAGPNARRASFRLAATPIPLALPMWATHAVSGTAGLRLALWDEDRKGLVGFRDIVLDGTR